MSMQKKSKKMLKIDLLLLIRILFSPLKIMPGIMRRRVIYSLSVLLLSLSFFTSCVSRKNITYFQGLEEVQQLNAENNLQIRPDDVLTIRVSAPEQEAALPFNLTKSVAGMALVLL